MKWSSVLALVWQQLPCPLYYILNFSVWNLSTIFVLWGLQWWVWHSSLNTEGTIAQQGFACGGNKPEGKGGEE